MIFNLRSSYRRSRHTILVILEVLAEEKFRFPSLDAPSIFGIACDFSWEVVPLRESLAVARQATGE